MFDIDNDEELESADDEEVSEEKQIGTEEVVFQIFEKLLSSIIDLNKYRHDYNWKNVVMSSTHLECKIILYVLQHDVNSTKETTRKKWKDDFSEYCDLVMQWYQDTETDLRLFQIIVEQPFISSVIKEYNDTVPRKKLSYIDFYTYQIIIEDWFNMEQIDKTFWMVNGNQQVINQLFKFLIEDKSLFYLQLSEMYNYDHVDLFHGGCSYSYSPEHVKYETISDINMVYNSVFKVGDKKTIVSLLSLTYEQFDNFELDTRRKYINVMKLFYKAKGHICLFIKIIAGFIKQKEMIMLFEDEIHFMMKNDITLPEVYCDNSVLNDFAKDELIEKAVVCHNFELIDYLLHKYPETEYLIKWNMLNYYDDVFGEKIFDGGLSQEMIDDIMRNVTVL